MTRMVGTHPRTRRRLAVALAVAAALVGLTATVAYGALGGFDTQTGTGALASEAGGDFNTADGYNALNANTVGTGINTEAPARIFQVGTGATDQFAGAYVQIPVVTASGTPPSGACDNPVLVGRMVLQAVKNKVKLWVCTPALVWKAV